MSTHLSLHRRQRAGRSPPGAGCVPRPRRDAHALDWRGTERAPLAESGTLPAMEASVLGITLGSDALSQRKPATASLHSARRPQAEHGIWGRQEARRPQAEHWTVGATKAYRGFESLSLRSCPLAQSR
jgi:hypothetical protein